jgi:hypothetical protein
LAAIPVVDERDLSFRVDKEGVLEGLAIHLELELDADNLLTSRCSGSHWANVFVMLGTEVTLQVGDEVQVKA